MLGIEDLIKKACDPETEFDELLVLMSEAEQLGVVSEELCLNILQHPNVVAYEDERPLLNVINKVAAIYPDLVALESPQFSIFAMIDGNKYFSRIANNIVKRCKDYNIALAVARAYKDNVAITSTLIRRSDAKLDVIREGATSPQILLRRSAAENTNTPESILELLSKDDDSLVVEMVASNPSTTTHLLEVLSKSSLSEVREKVAKNKNTPISCLFELSKDTKQYVVGAVARNRNSPAELLNSLGNHSSLVVLEGLCQNPSSPPELLRNLANYSTYLMREDLAENPSTPDDVLLRLSNSDDLSTKWKAQKNIAQRLPRIGKPWRSRQDPPETLGIPGTSRIVMSLGNPSVLRGDGLQGTGFHHANSNWGWMNVSMFLVVLL